MNILFITADQWRSECLSVLDHPVVRTPNLDALATEGMLFRNHFAQSTPCSPSRTSIHTGTYLHTHRVCINGTPIDHRRLTNWAQHTADAGYSALVVGYSDLPPDPGELPPDSQRLTHYSEPLPGAYNDTRYFLEVPINWKDYLESRGYEIPETLWNLYGNKAPGTDFVDGGEYPLPLAIAFEDHDTLYQTNRCIELLRRQNGPWVCHLSLLRPHPPYVAPEPYNTRYDPTDVDPWFREDTVEIQAGQHPWLRHQLSKKKSRAPDTVKGMQQIKSSYYGLMSEVDDCLGRLFDALREMGAWDDTLVIFSSDHGEQMGDQWLIGKCGYFDPSYHIPLIIRDPRKAADFTRGSQLNCFTENVDIMPTMLDYLDLAIPAQCQGYSLKSLVESGKIPPGWRTEAHWEYDFRNILDSTLESELGITQEQCALAVIRDERYKYVHFTALPPLFFDLQQDPHEMHNLVDDPAYTQKVLEYAQKLVSWRMNNEDHGYSQTYLCEPAPVTRLSPRIQLETPNQ